MTTYLVSYKEPRIIKVQAEDIEGALLMAKRRADEDSVDFVVYEYIDDVFR